MSNLTAFTIYYDNGEISHNSMAAGVTLDQAREYYVGQTFPGPYNDDDEGESQPRTAIYVEAYQPDQSWRERSAKAAKLLAL